jgi:hypothetical protein
MQPVKKLSDNLMITNNRQAFYILMKRTTESCALVSFVRW